MTTEEIDNEIQRLMDKRMEITGSYVKYIITCVCNHYQITEREMISKTRTEKLAWPRQLAMYFCYTKSNLTAELVGSEFNRVSHKNVLYAVQRVKDRISTSKLDKMNHDFLDDKIDSILEQVA